MAAAYPSPDGRSFAEFSPKSRSSSQELGAVQILNGLLLPQGGVRIATWAAGPAGVDPHALASGWDSRCERNAKVKGFIEYSLMPLYRFRH